MQSDVDTLNVEEDESLFGTPPPSSQIGRSPSPALALPSRSESIVNLQNVGTIALPGSHYHSELPVDPLALPSSALPQPVVQTQNSQGYSDGHMPSPHSSVPSTPSSSRASSQGPFPGRSKGKSCRRRREDDSHVVRLPPPEISLPDPTAPPPTNWLRSQSALLGHAGLVGGIKASTLSNRHSRGSTATNPIVINDDKHRSQHSCDHLSHNLSRPIPRYQLPENSDLPAPSIPEIVQILVKQREIFPVLQDILKLIQKGSPTFTKSTYSSSALGPAPKKRKLNKVPAGAVDWDVPYPFQPGEGPDAYSSTWEQTRGRQLVSQLVSLIKAASRKAAIRKHIEQSQQQRLHSALQQNHLDVTQVKESEHAMPKVDGLEAPLYGLPNTPPQAILADASNSSVGPSHLSTGSSPAPESSLLAELLVSLLTVTPNSGDSHEAATSSSNLDTLFVNINSQESTPELDQSVIDDWLSILQTYQVPFPLAPYVAGASLIPDLPMTLGPSTEVSDDPGKQSLSSFVDSVSSPSFSMDDVDAPVQIVAPTVHSLSMNSNLPNTSIQPSSSTVPYTVNSLDTPPLVYPPKPSSTDVQSMTPMLQAAGYLDVVNVPTATNRLNEEGKSFFLNDMMCEATGADCGRHRSVELMDRPEVRAQPQDVLSPSFSAVTLSALLPTLDSNVQSPLVNTGTSSVFMPPVVRPYKPPSNTINKAELLRRARDRRAQLAEEILKTRTHLWETTIEHGVLTRLAKFYI